MRVAGCIFAVFLLEFLYIHFAGRLHRDTLGCSSEVEMVKPRLRGLFGSVETLLFHQVREIAQRVLHILVASRRAGDPTPEAV
jgi:hypothetical protein